MIGTMKDDERTVSVRLSGETYAKVLEQQERMVRALPGSRPSLADALRVVLERGLAGIDAEQNPSRKRGR